MLALTGLSLPRGVLGPETWALARALSDDAGPAGDPAELAGAASAAHWPELRGPMEAALLRDRRARGRPRTSRRSTWSSSGRPTTTPTRLWRARWPCARPPSSPRRAPAPARRLRAAEAAIAQGGPEAAIAATSAAGAIAADLLDLDPEDFAIEIAEYVEAGSRPEDIEGLARATGDPEIRAWARAAVASTEAPGAPEAAAAVRHLAAGPPPEDPSEDLIWVPTILALTPRRSSARWPTRPPLLRRRPTRAEPRAPARAPRRSRSSAGSPRPTGRCPTRAATPR